jgi:hypothetical protein
MAKTAKSSQKGASAQPWAALYDLESRQQRAPAGSSGRGRGRPRSTIKRSTKSFRLSPDEARVIARARVTIESFLDERRVQKGQVLGLAARLLEDRLRGLSSETAMTWPELAEAVFGKDGP